MDDQTTYKAENNEVEKNTQNQPSKANSNNLEKDKKEKESNLAIKQKKHRNGKIVKNIIFCSIAIIVGLVIALYVVHPHQFGNWAVVKDATCTENGTMERKCFCGEKETQNIEAIGHNYVEYNCSVCNASVGEGMVFTLNDDGNSYSLTKLGDCIDTDVIIPPTYNGLSVTCIGELAFYNSSIISVTIPDSVHTIEKNAFSECKSLTSITISNSVKTIGAAAFSRCESLVSITLPDSIVTIESNTFSNCESLTSIIIPDSVTEIGSSAFSNCKSLTNVVIPDSITSIEYSAFANCDSLQYNEHDSFLYLGNEGNPYVALIGYKNNTIEACEIHNDTKVIMDNALYGCDSIKTLIVPEFIDLIPLSILGNCSSLTNIIVNENNKNYKSIDGNLYSKDGSILINYPNGKSDSTFSIPNHVETIGEWAFSDCTQLNKIIIAGSVKTIEQGAFAECTSLKYAVILTPVNTIGAFAFRGCTSLESITISSSVIEIGNYAFENCSSLSTVNYNGTEKEWKKISIGNYNTYLNRATRNYTSDPW